MLTIASGIASRSASALRFTPQVRLQSNPVVHHTPQEARQQQRRRQCRQHRHPEQGVGLALPLVVGLLEQEHGVVHLLDDNTSPLRDRGRRHVLTGIARSITEELIGQNRQFVPSEAHGTELLLGIR